jgi:hypothetical protein
VINWQDAASRLHRCGYRDALTMEMNVKSKPGRHENDAYAALPLEVYFARCHERLQRIDRMMETL